MDTFVAILHVLVAIVLVILVLIQDSKGGGALGIGGGGSNSILGATGAQTLAARLTRWTAVIFAITCMSLTWFSSRSQKSVVDTGVLPAAAPQTAPAALPQTPEAAPTPTTGEPAK